MLTKYPSIDVFSQRSKLSFWRVRPFNFGCLVWATENNATSRDRSYWEFRAEVTLRMQVSPPTLGGEAAAVSEWNHFVYCRSGVVPKPETVRK